MWFTISGVQGRSEVADLSTYTYRQYADDLKTIIDAFALRSPVLLAHSHGGPIAIKFEEFYPQVAKSIVLISATLDFGGTIHSVSENCAARLNRAGETADLERLAQLNFQLFMNPNATLQEQLNAMSSIFIMGATKCFLYSVARPTPERTKLYEQLGENPIQGENLENAERSGTGFFTNEPLIKLNLVSRVSANKSRYCGIYGIEDGLFTILDRSNLQSVLNPSIRIISGASHSLYIDQRSEFFDALENTCKIRPIK